VIDTNRPDLAPAAAEVVNGLWNGAIWLDVPSIDDWLLRFSELINEVSEYRTDLTLVAQRQLVRDGLGHFELSRQILAKIADRTGDTKGGLAWALDDVIEQLRNIHEAIDKSKATLAERDG
jgi:hypothetical protein